MSIEMDWNFFYSGKNTRNDLKIKKAYVFIFKCLLNDIENNDVVKWLR